MALQATEAAKSILIVRLKADEQKSFEKGEQKNFPDILI